MCVFILSCSPTPNVRSYIKKYEKNECKFPLIYKSVKYKVIKYIGNDLRTEIYHTYKCENVFGVPSEHTSKTILYKNGTRSYEGSF